MQRRYVCKRWRRAGLLALVAFSVSAGSGCETIKPYEKEYLLDPTMDDAGVSALGSDMMTTGAAGFEKLGQGGAGVFGAASCPTCGG